MRESVADNKKNGDYEERCGEYNDNKRNYNECNDNEFDDNKFNDNGDIIIRLKVVLTVVMEEMNEDW